MSSLVGHILGCTDLLASTFNRYMKATFYVMCHMLIRFMAIVTSQLFFLFTFCRRHKWYNISFLALISTILNVMYTHNCKGLVY